MRNLKIVCFKKGVRKIKFLIILWIWLITGCSLPVNRIENNYYLTILESGIELNTNGEIIKKWNCYFNFWMNYVVRKKNRIIINELKHDSNVTEKMT